MKARIELFELLAEAENDVKSGNTVPICETFQERLDKPNKETIAAMMEAERVAHDPNVKHYSDVEEALRELKR